VKQPPLPASWYFLKKERVDTDFLRGNREDREAAGGDTAGHPKELLRNIFFLFPDLHASAGC